MKNVTYNTSGVTTFVFKCQYLWPSNSLLRKYNQLGNLTSSFALFLKSSKMLIIKYFVG